MNLLPCDKKNEYNAIKVCIFVWGIVNQTNDTMINITLHCLITGKNWRSWEMTIREPRNWGGRERRSYGGSTRSIEPRYSEKRRKSWEWRRRHRLSEIRQRLKSSTLASVYKRRGRPVGFTSCFFLTFMQVFTNSFRVWVFSLNLLSHSVTFIIKKTCHGSKSRVYIWYYGGIQYCFQQCSFDIDCHISKEFNIVFNGDFWYWLPYYAITQNPVGESKLCNNDTASENIV